PLCQPGTCAGERLVLFCHSVITDLMQHYPIFCWYWKRLKFIIIWFGQLISLFGSGLTGFGLGVWVYQRTGSVTQFALIALFATLPTILISPLLGEFVDRWDRRTV